MFNINHEEAKAKCGSLTYKGKKVIADIYGRAEFAYVLEVGPTLRLSGIVKIYRREFEIEKLDCLFEGPPPGFIKGESLYFIGTDVRYFDLKSLPRTIEREELEELQKGDVEVIVLGTLEKKKPLLILCDWVGVTAELPDPANSAELGLTHYQKRPMGWVCPSDKVYESLSLLYAGGWRIENSQGQEVIPFERLDLDWEFGEDNIYLKGQARFYGDAIDIEAIGKQRQVPLSDTQVGLLPDTFKLFQWEKKVLEKQNIGKLADLMGKEVLQQKRGSFYPLQSTDPNEDFQGELRPYQQEGLNWLWFLYQNGFSGLLADDMGLGKTVQTLAFLSKVAGQILIVMPTSLQFNWRAEIERFLPNRRQDITLVSYAYLRQNESLFRNTAWEAVILDEAQAIKNRATDTFKAASSLNCRFRLSITGTPIENRASELESQFAFLMPSLKEHFSPFILRRKKEHVLKDLPEKIEETVWVEMSEAQKSVYDRFLADAKAGELTNPIEILEVILRLRQIACHPLLAGFEAPIDVPFNVQSAKLELVLNDIETLVLEGRKVLLFSQFTSMLKLIGKEVKARGIAYHYLDGETKEREAIVRAFQQDAEPLLFLMSLKAGGLGLNLTAADTVLIFDPWWNLAVEEQAAARAHRIGQKKSVHIKRYVAKGTIEEKIEELKQAKKNLADQLIGEGNLSSEALLRLIYS